MVVENFTVIIVLGLACVYTLVSAVLINSALARITGKELRHLMIALFVTVVAGFFFGLFQLLNQLGLIDGGNEMIINFINSFLFFTMFVMLIYLSFLTRELGRRFGFRLIGRDIKNKLNSKKGRKHSL